MKIDDLISGNVNISIPFDDYFSGLSGNTIILSSAKEYISILNKEGKVVAKVRLGSSVKKCFNVSNKTIHNPDLVFYAQFGVLMNGVNGRDWLFKYEQDQK